MEILKRILAFLMIIMIIISVIYVPKIYAVDNMIIDNPYNRQLIGTLLVASGLLFSKVDDMNEVLDDFIDEWNDHETGWQMPGGPNDPKNWADLLFYITAIGVTVYDLGFDTIKQVINMPQNLMDYFKEWVNEKFDVGENIINPNYLLFQYGNYKVSFVVRKFINEADGLMYDYLYISLNGGPETIVGGHPNGFYNIGLVNVLPSNYNYTVKVCYKLKNQDGSLTNMFNQNVYDVINGNTDPYLGETIYGIPDIVDNPNYTYTHNKTNEPTIVIPIQSPEQKEDGYFIPDGGIEDLINQDYEDIANSNTDGIVLPDISNPEVSNPDVDPVPYPELPGEDIATEEDFDTPNKRALYQLKFPFSLPWDIKAVFNLLKAPAKAPRFEIDVVTSSIKSKIGITGETKFIFDMGEFELIGQVTRFFSFIGFCLTLIYVTRFIIRS